MSEKLIYLDTYILQKDMRIRLPKSILTNLNAEKGISMFDIYFCQEEKTLILKITEDEHQKRKEVDKNA